MIRLRKGMNAEVALRSIFEELYMEFDYRTDKAVYNPDKEWDSGADFLEYIALRVNDVMEWVPDKKSKKD